MSLATSVFWACAHLLIVLSWDDQIARVVVSLEEHVATLDQGLEEPHIDEKMIRSGIWLQACVPVGLW